VSQPAEMSGAPDRAPFSARVLAAVSLAAAILLAVAVVVFLARGGYRLFASQAFNWGTLPVAAIIILALGGVLLIFLGRRMTHLQHRWIASYCCTKGYEFGMSVVSRLRPP